MNNFKRFICLALAGSVLVSLMGCEWESSGDGETWNDRYNWVNFTGVYSGTDGGLLVSDFTAQAAPDVTTDQIEGERIATVAAGNTVYSGVLRHGDVVAGSMQVVAGVIVLTDDGSGSWVSNGGSNITGRINYATGAWDLDLGDGPYPPDGTPITVVYQYELGAAGVDDDSGVTGIAIYQFVVSHNGNLISLTDNNGSVYSGELGRVSTTGSIDQDTDPENRLPAAGTIVFADYQVKGTSKAGKRVTMIGTFQGVLAGSGVNAVLGDRVMLGTWLEDNGKTGDINGEAGDVAIEIIDPIVTAAVTQ